MQFNWSANFVPRESSNGRLFTKFDFDAYCRATKEYSQLDQEIKKQYRGKEQFIEKEYKISLSSLNKNYILLMDELDARFKSTDKTENFEIGKLIGDNILFELLASIENETYIRDMYKIKKKKVASSGLNQKEAVVLINCMRQGRSLLEAGKRADILAKPLIDFYAATAYAYAIIVLNSPLHKSLDGLKGSHGHSYDHENGIVTFGGCTSRGTFLDLMGTFFSNSVSYNNTEVRYSLLESIDFLQKNTVSLSLMTLFSMVPEIQRFYATCEQDKLHYLVHRLTFDNKVTNNSVVSYNFYVGDGCNMVNADALKECFHVNDVQEDNKSYVVEVNGENLKNINPMIYQDIYGKLWYVETPIKGLHIPEICLHYLIISVLSNIMRYSPHDWNRILNSQDSTAFSLLIRRYLWLFENKFPMLVVKFLTNYLPIYSAELW